MLGHAMLCPWFCRVLVSLCWRQHRGNLEKHGSFMGISCMYWSILCCLKDCFGGTEEVDVESGGKKHKEHV